MLKTREQPEVDDESRSETGEIRLLECSRNPEKNLTQHRPLEATGNIADKPRPQLPNQQKQPVLGE